jgi:hypothetical protein
MLDVYKIKVPWGKTTCLVCWIAASCDLADLEAHTTLPLASQHWSSTGHELVKSEREMKRSNLTAGSLLPVGMQPNFQSSIPTL